MYCCYLLVLTAIAAAPAVLAQFVSPPTDLKTAKGYADISVRYKQVPAGICEQNPKVKSFSGYADVAEDQHIFWWFFEARNADPTTAPLTVWINGGPGASSMIGLFQENGPCAVDSDGNVFDNPYSWSNASNMIYIDQPTQTGFSYSIPVPGYTDDEGTVIELPSANCPDYAASTGTCGTYSYPNITLTANSTAGAAPNFWKTLQGFMGVFPQYSRHGFHFTSESYGGHYGPVFSEYIETQNAKNMAGTHEIHLQSVLIGNGWYDPLIQYQAYYNFTVFPGNTYDYSPFNASLRAQFYNSLYGPGNCVDQITDCALRGSNEVCSNADSFCASEVESFYDIHLHRDEYDIRELNPDPFPPEFYVDYLNTRKVQRAIGAFQNFTEVANVVTFSSTGDDGREDSTLEDIAALLQQGIYVVLFAGDADYNCNWLGGQAVANLINPPGFSSAGYANISTLDGLVHGQVKQAGSFSFARIYESGHEVPFYQPLTALTLFERTITGMDIESGRQRARSGYVTKGPRESTFREGNSTVQFHKVGVDATYNTTTGAPNPPKRRRSRGRTARRSRGSRRSRSPRGELL